MTDKADMPAQSANGKEQAPPSSAQIHPCRLYVVSPPAIDIPSFCETLPAVLAAGDVSVFQLRLKNVEHEYIKRAAEAVMPICRDAGVAFIMNDDVELVAELGADGVHLGQEDMPLKEARATLGEDAVIGISCHDSPHMAMEAGENGADYVAFGAFFETMSKPPEKLAKYGTPTLDMLRWWSTYTVVPSVAIGGMTPENCVEPVAHGADFIAAIQAIWNHKDGAPAGVKAFNDAIKRGLQKRSTMPDVTVEEAS